MIRIIVGDCLRKLRLLPDRSVHCVVTSPPYWGLRQYFPDGVRIKVDAPPEVLAELESLGIKPIDHEECEHEQ